MYYVECITYNSIKCFASGKNTNFSKVQKTHIRICNFHFHFFAVLSFQEMNISSKKCAVKWLYRVILARNWYHQTMNVICRCVAFKMTGFNKVAVASRVFHYSKWPKKKLTQSVKPWLYQNSNNKSIHTFESKITTIFESVGLGIWIVVFSKKNIMFLMLWLMV